VILCFTVGILSTRIVILCFTVGIFSTRIVILCFTVGILKITTRVNKIPVGKHNLNSSRQNTSSKTKSQTGWTKNE
jgi:hypothetical protein